MLTTVCKRNKHLKSDWHFGSVWRMLVGDTEIKTAIHFAELFFFFFTSFKLSKTPETGKALVTSLATECMWMNPRHSGFRLKRKAASPSLPLACSDLRRTTAVMQQLQPNELLKKLKGISDGAAYLASSPDLAFRKLSSKTERCRSSSIAGGFATCPSSDLVDCLRTTVVATLAALLGPSSAGGTMRPGWGEKKESSKTQSTDPKI